jgi:hypothetical protein
MQEYQGTTDETAGDETADALDWLEVEIMAAKRRQIPNMVSP